MNTPKVVRRKKGREEEYTFKVLGTEADTSLPTWSRRPKKWDELISMVAQLTPGNKLVIEFPNAEVANRARNVVRDVLNAQIGRAAIRTRMVDRGEGESAQVHFVRLHPLDIVESD